MSPPRRQLAPLAAAILAASATACAGMPSTRERKVYDVQYGRPFIRIEGTFHATDRGVELALDDGLCVQLNTYIYEDGIDKRSEPCHRAADTGALAPNPTVVLTSPFGHTVDAEIAPSTRIVEFPIDWAALDVDPLAPDADDRVAGTWEVRSVETGETLAWTPDRSGRTEILAAIGHVTGTEIEVEPLTLPPKLEVVAFGIEGGRILAGGKTRMHLTLTNRGRGAAYRVTARVRSSLEALHGLQFSFGRIEPGEAERRELTLSIDPIPAESAMVVLAIDEANHFRPPNHSKRFPVKVVGGKPSLTMACRAAGAELGDAPAEVDAGEPMRLRCTVANHGGARARAVRLSVRHRGRKLGVSAPVDIGITREETVVVPVDIPEDAAIDEELALHVAAREQTAGVESRTRVSVVVRVPKLCPDGRLTRAEYKAKKRELERAHAAGALTREELDRFDAELVGCLQ